MSETVEYKCTECGAKDSDRSQYETAPAALICFNCGAGRGMKVADQVRLGRGMLPEVPDARSA